MSTRIANRLRTVNTCEPLPRVSGMRAPDGREFPWGPIVTIHTVGDHAIVEYLRDCSNLVDLTGDGYAQHGQARFAVYAQRADGTYRSATRSYLSLDSALVGAIAMKREGANTRADSYFDRMTLPADEQVDALAPKSTEPAPRLAARLG